jgi:hypothetical protein
MDKSFIGEVWKPIFMDFGHVNEQRVEISNFGRVRSFTQYRIVKFKLFKPHDPATQKKLGFMREQIALLVRNIGKMRTRNKAKRIKDQSYYEVEERIAEQSSLLATIQKEYRKEYRAAERKRTINKGFLVHRLVAEYFVPRLSEKHFIVAHLDYNKTNNHFENIRWMTRAENVEHQKKSPFVISARKRAMAAPRNEQSKVYKLNNTKVMFIKKRINEGVPLRTLAKSFKVTETQLLRIKRGENWGHVKPAD